jgi:Putative prokaryotic signal transducing protein
VERCVFVASGEIEAQQIQAFLASAGIRSILRGESVRKTHGLTLDGLVSVEILVDEVDEVSARELLASAEAGQFRLNDEEAPKPPSAT